MLARGSEALSGLSEVQITIDDVAYCTDGEKVAVLFGEIGASLPHNYELQRLGKQSLNYCRAVKLIVVNKTNRDNILQKSKELKDAT